MKQPEFPQSQNDNLSASELAVLRQVRRRRIGAAFASAGALTLMLFATGCPEAADNMTPNDTAGQGGSSPGGGSGAGGASCETECVKQVFSVKATGCKICHDSGANMTLKSAGMDLVTPGFTARLLNQPALHTDITTMGFNAATDCPQGDLLIDANNPPNSWMVKKIRKQQGKCGDKMPSTMDLTVTDQKCVEDYIRCVVGGKSIDGGATIA